jgi:tetratricopeptide (TPR) repeat protein
VTSEFATTNPSEAAAPQAQPAKPPRTSASRSRWLLVGAIAVAASSALAIVGARHYGLGFADRKFEAALTALAQGDASQARQYARELKSSGDASQRASFLRGATLLKKGYYYPALDVLEKAKHDPELKVRALTLMGQAWYQLGRHIEAQAVLLEALQDAPDSAEAHRWLAASYYDLGVIDDAVRHLLRTAELDSTDPRPHRLLGLMHKDFERFEDAIPFYQESLACKADQEDASEIRRELAVCQIKARRNRDALATLARCPDQPAIEVLRAECLHGLGQIAPAKAALARALKGEHDNLGGLLLNGTILLEEGDARAAIDPFRRAIDKHPKDYTAHFMLAQAYGKAGEQELAKPEHEAAEKIRVVRHEFSQLHKAAWERPGDVRVRLRLAALAQELGRPDLAEVWLRSAAALQPIPSSQNK